MDSLIELEKAYFNFWGFTNSFHSLKNHRLLRKEPYHRKKEPNEPKMPIPDIKNIFLLLLQAFCLLITFFNNFLMLHNRWLFDKLRQKHFCLFIWVLSFFLNLGHFECLVQKTKIKINKFYFKLKKMFEIVHQKKNFFLLNNRLFLKVRSIQFKQSNQS
jgi:hypothetical protein